MIAVFASLIMLLALFAILSVVMDPPRKAPRFAEKRFVGPSRCRPPIQGINRKSACSCEPYGPVCDECRRVIRVNAGVWPGTGKRCPKCRILIVDDGTGLCGRCGDHEENERG